MPIVICEKMKSLVSRVSFSRLPIDERIRSSEKLSIGEKERKQRRTRAKTIDDLGVSTTVVARNKK